MSATGEFEKLLETLGTALEGVLDEQEAAPGGDPKGEAGLGREASVYVRSEPRASMAAGASGDAIERELAGAPRMTQVVSLRESEVVEAFRRELTDGFIRADTVNRLLRLVNEVVTRLV